MKLKFLPFVMSALLVFQPLQAQRNEDLVRTGAGVVALGLLKILTPKQSPTLVYSYKGTSANDVEKRLKHFQELSNKQSCSYPNGVFYYDEDEEIANAPKGAELGHGLTADDYTYETEKMVDYSPYPALFEQYRGQVGDIYRRVNEVWALTKLGGKKVEDPLQRVLLLEIINHYEAKDKSEVGVNMQKVKKEYIKKGTLNKKFLPYIQQYAYEVNKQIEPVYAEMGKYLTPDSINVKVISGVKNAALVSYTVNGFQFANKKNPVFCAINETSGGWWQKVSGNLLTWVYASYREEYDKERPNEKMKQEYVTFPIRTQYYVHPDFPDYAVKYDQDSGYPEESRFITTIYDKKGNLLCVNCVPASAYASRESIDKSVKERMFVQWYRENRHDIREQSAKTTNYVEEKLGLRKAKTSASVRNTANRAKTELRNMNKAKNYRQYQQAKTRAGFALLGLMASMPYDEIGNNYLSQLEQDWEDLFTYVYDVERVSDTRIDVVFLDKDLRQLTRVAHSYYSPRPFEVRRSFTLESVSPLNLSDADREFLVSGSKVQ